MILNVGKYMQSYHGWVPWFLPQGLHIVCWTRLPWIISAIIKRHLLHWWHRCSCNRWNRPICWYQRNEPSGKPALTQQKSWQVGVFMDGWDENFGDEDEWIQKMGMLDGNDWMGWGMMAEKYWKDNASIIFTILKFLYLFQHLPIFYLKDELMVFKTLEDFIQWMQHPMILCWAQNRWRWGGRKGGTWKDTSRKLT